MTVPHSRIASLLATGALALASSSCSGEDQPGAPPVGPALEGEVVAFVDVNVLPMDRDEVLSGQTVVVHDGLVRALGPLTQTPIPEGATEIDGAARYLLPGLAEMHGHLPNPSFGEELTEDVLFLYVANGITLVRGMQGHPTQLKLRQRIEAGEVVGPHLVVGSPAMSGNNVTDPEQARRLVREYHQAGYDLLKVHEGLTREVYDALAATANEVGIPFGGHVSDLVGLERALEAGQATIDHLDNYIEALVPAEALREATALSGVSQLIERADESRIPALVEATRRAGAAVVPTMVLWQSGLFPTRSSEELLAERAEVRYVPRQMVDGWARGVDQRLADADPGANRAVAELRRRVLQALHEGGADVLLGTDSPQIFSVPGFSIHREMRFMVEEAGMTPYEVLESGTRRVAEHFGTDAFGTVAVGKRADLLLVEGNPLTDIGNVARRAGVMVAGRWISESVIQERLAQVAATYRTGGTR